MQLTAEIGTEQNKKSQICEAGYLPVAEWVESVISTISGAGESGLFGVAAVGGVVHSFQARIRPVAKGEALEIITSAYIGFL